MRVKKAFYGVIVGLAGLLCLLFLSACGAKETPVMTYKDVSVSPHMYQYWLSGYKAMFLYTYGENSKDSASFWEEVLDEGVTTESFFTAIADESIKKKLVIMSLFREYDLTLSKTVKNNIKERLDQLVEDLGEGKKSQFNAYAANYGVNYDILYDIYLEEAKMEVVKDYLYGSYGIEKITDEQRQEYYEANYARMKHIFIRTKDRLVTDEDGKYIHDGEKYLTEELTVEEKAEKQAKIEELAQKLDNGGDFEALLGEYSEDEASAYYKNGFYFTASTDYIAEVLRVTFEMEIGEVRRVESEFGVHFIKRYPLDEKAYSDKMNADFFSTFESDVIESVYDAKLSELIKDVVVNTEEKNKIKASEIAANWSL
ncbi:MAG: hypothetical protein GX303_04500 [Clostridiales bacterium]|nr:hypothetical protein [Clostridiales bacterium]